MEDRRSRIDISIFNLLSSIFYPPSSIFDPQYALRLSTSCERGFPGCLGGKTIAGGPGRIQLDFEKIDLPFGAKMVAHLLVADQPYALGCRTAPLVPTEEPDVLCERVL